MRATTSPPLFFSSHFSLSIPPPLLQLSPNTHTPLTSGTFSTRSPTRSTKPPSPHRLVIHRTSSRRSPRPPRRRCCKGGSGHAATGAVKARRTTSAAARAAPTSFQRKTTGAWRGSRAATVALAAASATGRWASLTTASESCWARLRCGQSCRSYPSNGRGQARGRESRLPNHPAAPNQRRAWHLLREGSAQSRRRGQGPEKGRPEPEQRGLPLGQPPEPHPARLTAPLQPSPPRPTRVGRGEDCRESGLAAVMGGAWVDTRTRSTNERPGKWGPRPWGEVRGRARTRRRHGTGRRVRRRSEAI